MQAPFRRTTMFLWLVHYNAEIATAVMADDKTEARSLADLIFRMTLPPRVRRDSYYMLAYKTED